MSDALHIEAPESLRLVSCTVCAIRFSVPLDLYLLQVNSAEPLHCPHGHRFKPQRLTDDPLSNYAQMCVELRAALADAHVQLAAARSQVAQRGPVGIDRKELQRRSHLLTARAQEARFGRCVCPCCGRLKSRVYLAEHLRRQHRQLLAEMPAEAFIAASTE